MNAVYPVPRFSLPLEDSQREQAEQIAHASGQSLTDVLKLAITLGLPSARAAMCPPPDGGLTDLERERSYAAMSEEDLALDRAMGTASLQAQQA